MDRVAVWSEIHRRLRTGKKAWEQGKDRGQRSEINRGQQRPRIK